MEQNNTHEKLLKLVATAVMTAIVFVGNYLRITMPVPLGGVTSFTLANILCALAGILLGPWYGFLAAGLGSAFYDLTNPAYAIEAPITLYTKGMYGLIAGVVLYYVLKHAKEKYGAQLAATVCAAVGYGAHYMIKTYFFNGMYQYHFTDPAQCWALVVSKIPATITNGVIAIIFAPILGVALMKAMKSAHLEKMLAQ
ncbi:MAG: ECF transporter S component [Oscillospiraceae bacterium]|nr:ECF transporter S component [Oscillospiraceae bacterium]